MGRIGRELGISREAVRQILVKEGVETPKPLHNEVVLLECDVCHRLFNRPLRDIKNRLCKRQYNHIFCSNIYKDKMDGNT
jgi:hypothetical protein